MEDDERGKKLSARAVWAVLTPILWSLRGFILLCVLFALGNAALVVAEPYLYGRIIDAVTLAVAVRQDIFDGVAAILPFLAWWAVVVLGETTLTALHAWTVWYIGNQLEWRSQEQTFGKMLALSVGRFQSERVGALLNRFVSGGEGTWSVSNLVFRVFLQSVATLLLVIAAGFWIDWRLALAALAVVPIDVAVGFWHLHLSLNKQDKLQQQWEKTTGIVGDAFSNITTVQGASGEAGVVKRYAAIWKKVLGIQLRLNMAWAGVDAFTNGVNVASRLVIFVVGVRLVLSGDATLGTLITFLGFAGFLYGSVQTVFASLPEFVRSFNRLSRLMAVASEVPEVRDRDGARMAPHLRGEIELDDVWFSYQDAPDKNVLRGLSVKIPAGKTYAVIGESGAGKSSLAKLLVRFADPTRGAVRMDGHDLRDLTLASLRPQIGFVMQENMLFHESILENLRFARPKATREAIMEAARLAQAHAFILKLPKGYDTVVGERGVKLSGGQKQRIALARVLLANPPILVLDEATSALDSKTEHDLQKALREVMKNRTTIVIAHRLSTVMDADNILVMDKGRIVDQGRHHELIERDTLYKRFWEIQAGGYV